MTLKRFFFAAVALALIASACGNGDDTSAAPDTTHAPETTAAPDTTHAPETTAAPDTTQAPETTAAPDTTSAGELGPQFADEGRTLDAPQASIVVDGDVADWADVPGLDMTLYPITDERFEEKQSTLKVAVDADNVYVLMQVNDDYDWNPEDLKLSSALAVQWAVDPGAGEAMGATDADRETSLGLVDIWHWELQCAAGEGSGGAVSGPGEGNDPGNDENCNFDDEYATDVETREDDNGDGAENSLFGVWTHSAMVANEDGTWTFEMSRPFATGDANDVQFEAGSSALVATAYWDADSGPDGWKDEYHVQSANQGWITVNFASPAS